MGDHAQDAIDREIDSWLGDYDDNEGDLDAITIRNTYKTCRYCQRRSLHWQKFDGKWRLFDGDEIHICPEYRLVKVKVEKEG